MGDSSHGGIEFNDGAEQRKRITFPPRDFYQQIVSGVFLSFMRHPVQEHKPCPYRRHVGFNYDLTLTVSMNVNLRDECKPDACACDDDVFDDAWQLRRHLTRHHQLDCDVS